MNALDLLKIKPLTGAKLIAGQAGMENNISGVNVLEATDIENWGREGQVILTSLFALKNLTDQDLDAFFNKMHTIGIAAIIVKIDRLVQYIPEMVIHLCNKHGIVLIQIDKETKYESIILEILEPIINRNMYLLNRYYDVHSEITRIAMKMPSLESVLKEFKTMINMDLSLVNKVKNAQISTNTELEHFQVINHFEIEKKKYMYYTYERYGVKYLQNGRESYGNQIRVKIPCLDYNDYELIIHELTSTIREEDFMVLENAVKYLQMELLKKNALSQNIYQQKNSIISDLLNDRIHEEKDLDDVLDYLDMTSFPLYQVIIVKLIQEEDNKAFEWSLDMTIKRLRYHFKNHMNHFAFMEKNNRIVLLLNIPDEDSLLCTDHVQKIMTQFEHIHKKKNFNYQIGISSSCRKETLGNGNQEALDTQKILNLFYPTDSVLEYASLGIYKLFLNADNLETLETFVSPKLKAYKEDHPELFKTLALFIDNNQNYLKTAESLFLHSKTVRYRIDKIKKQLNMTFDDSESIIHIQIASRLFKLLDMQSS